MTKKKVLLLGIDSKLIDPNLSTATGWDANRVRAAAQDQTRDWWNWDTNCKAASLILRGLMKCCLRHTFKGKI